MNRRPPSPHVASPLLVLQLLMAPSTYAEVTPSSDVDCAGMTQNGRMSMGAADCDDMTADTARLLRPPK